MPRTYVASLIVPLAALLSAMLCITVASALPDSSTAVLGADCARGHSFRYSYTITAPKTVTVGEEFTVSLEFKLSSDTRVMRSPRTVEALLSASGASGIEIMSPSSQALSPMASWKVKAPGEGMLSLEFQTEFFIDGTDFHRGYTATYEDEIAVTIQAGQPGADMPASNGTAVVAQTVTEEFEAQLPAEPDSTSWFVTRIVGLLAYLALFLSVLTALLKKVGVWAKSKGLILLFRYHHDVSLLSLALALFHGLSNVADKFMWNLSLDRVLLPHFGSQNQNLIALGVIAFYIMLAVVGTSLGGMGMKRLGPKNWKYVHMASYAAFFFVFIHSILLGTDLKSGGLVGLLFWVSGLVILGISLYLLMRKWTR